MFKPKPIPTIKVTDLKWQNKLGEGQSNMFDKQPKYFYVEGNDCRVRFEYKRTIHRREMPFSDMFEAIGNEYTGQINGENFVIRLFFSGFSSN